jgi:hypothetical protein
VQFRHQKTIAGLLLALVAFASSGDVAMHRIAYWHGCQCFAAIPANDGELNCDCIHDHSPPAPNEHRDSRIAGDSDCFIGSFFRQSADPRVVPLLAEWTEVSDSFLSVDAVVIDASWPPAYWSRGPPVHG